MGNAQQQKQNCENGTGWVLDALGDATCEAGATTFEAVCQTIAIANMEDGIGEILEPICDLSGGAFGYACRFGSEASQWIPKVKAEICR